MEDALLDKIRTINLDIKGEILIAWCKDWQSRHEDGVFNIMIRHQAHFLHMQLMQLTQETLTHRTSSTDERFEKVNALREIAFDEVRNFMEMMHEEYKSFLVRFILYAYDASTLECLRSFNDIVSRSQRIREIIKYEIISK